MLQHALTPQSHKLQGALCGGWLPRRATMLSLMEGCASIEVRCRAEVTNARLSIVLSRGRVRVHYRLYTFEDALDARKLLENMWPLGCASRIAWA